MTETSEQPPVITRQVHPRLPVELLDRLEAYRRRNGLPTLHSVLNLACAHGMTYLETWEIAPPDPTLLYQFTDPTDPTPDPTPDPTD